MKNRLLKVIFLAKFNSLLPFRFSYSECKSKWSLVFNLPLTYYRVKDVRVTVPFLKILKIHRKVSRISNLKFLIFLKFKLVLHQIGQRICKKSEFVKPRGVQFAFDILSSEGCESDSSFSKNSKNSPQSFANFQSEIPNFP